MDPLWLLKGPPGAPGWGALQRDAASGVADVLHFDQHAWALVRAAAAPGGYPGLTPVPPPDGLYLDAHGRPVYVAGCQEVHSARAVIRALGPAAAELLESLGDPDLVLERLGRAY